MFNSRWWSQSGRDSKTPPIDAGKNEKSPGSNKANISLKDDLIKGEQKFSADRLRNLYAKLTSEPSITDSNSTEIVSTLRSISEILIWGDKNDPSVFEYFLEKHMLQNFVSILQQCGNIFSGNYSHSPVPVQPETTGKSPLTSLRIRRSSGGKNTTETTFSNANPFSVQAAHHVCIQVLQLLNILFENITQETSLYFLLSNNFINQIISSTYDFTDEEILAHYISLMKILSGKLNQHTIHFFHSEDSASRLDNSDWNFPLFTKALSLFMHPENMVRIASRTVILNIFSVRHPQSVNLSYIRLKEMPLQLLSLLCTILNDQVSQMRISIEQASSLSRLSYILPNAEGIVARSEDIAVTRQQILDVWSKRQKIGRCLNDLTIEFVEYIQYVNDLSELNVQPLSGCIFDRFRSDFLLPCVLLPIVEATNVLLNQSHLDTSRRLELSSELLIALILLNLVVLNVSNLSIIFSDDIDIHGSLLKCLTVFNNDSELPKDDRLPLFTLTILNTLTARVPALNKELQGTAQTFFNSSCISAVIQLIFQIPQAGLGFCRSVVLRLACNFIESYYQRFSIDGQEIALLIEAKNQFCQILYRFYEVSNFVRLVELEVHVRKQQKPIRIDALLERELLSLLLFCPCPYSLMDFKDSSKNILPEPLPPASGMNSTTDERGFPELCKRLSLSADEDLRWSLKGFFLLRHLTYRISIDKDTSEQSSIKSSECSSSISDSLPAPVQSLQIGDVVDISSCDTILSCMVIPFHTHLANKSPRSPSSGAHHRPAQILICASDEEKWVKRFLIIHQWQMLLVEPDSRKAGFAVVKESYALPNVVLLNEKEQRERIICCCSLANGGGHRNHDVNPMGGIDTKIVLKSIFVQIEQSLIQRLTAAPNDAPWNMDLRYEFYTRVIFDDSIRAMAASTRIKKNQERIRELKLGGIQSLLDLPNAGSPRSVSEKDSTEEISPRIAISSAQKLSNINLITAASRKRGPIVIHAPGKSHSQSPEASHLSKIHAKSSSRDRISSFSVREDKSTNSGLPSKLDAAARSGHAERVEPNK